MSTESPKTSFVYVIRLDPTVLEIKKFREANSQHVLGADCYYVGRTDRTPELRFEQHKPGYKADRFAKEFGIELMPPRFSHINPLTREQSVRFEVRLAKRLRKRGFAVW
jgi:hypothetical protein